MRKIKILHIINNLEIGGAETVLALLLRELREYPDLDITLVSLEGHGPLENKILSSKVRYKKFRYHLYIPVLSRMEIFFRLRLFIYALKLRPDVIHGHLCGGEGFAEVLGALLSVPVVITRHDTIGMPRKKQLLLNRLVTQAVAVSPVVQEYLHKVQMISKEKTIVIPDAIERDIFLDSVKRFDSKNPVFIYIGRLYKTKGIECSIIALAQLWKEVPSLRFLIYGKEVEASDLRKWKKLVRNNHWEFVQFMGPTQNVPEALRLGDIFILASQTEGFAMAPLEAAAASKPLILTRAGAMSEMIVEGENGYFVEYGNAEAIYQAAKKILAADVERMGEFSREKISTKFDISKVAKMYYNLYLRVAKK